jgi:hypothetical protein
MRTRGEAISEIEEARAENRRLWEALSKYGDHTYGCKITDDEDDAKCTCGYSAALGVP